MIDLKQLARETRNRCYFMSGHAEAIEGFILDALRQAVEQEVKLRVELKEQLAVRDELLREMTANLSYPNSFTESALLARYEALKKNDP